MSLETNSNEAFLGGNNSGGEDFAALDSMSFTNQSQYGMNTVNLTAQPQQQQPPPPNMNHNPPAGAGGSAVADGSSGGFAGVSGSLFDRIKARAEEQQNAPAPSQQQQQQQQQPAAQSSSQQSAFMSQQPPPQGGGEATMEIERNKSDPYNSSTSPFGNVGGQGTPTTSQPAQNNNNETTYSFSASGGEDFSQTATSQPPGAGLLRIPQYDQVNYASSDNNEQQQYNQPPSSLQEHAQNALQQTGPILKSLWDAGVNGAQSVGAMAQSKISGSNANNSGEAAVAGGRQYNNNFLLREDSMGGGGPHVQQPPHPLSAADLDPEAAAGGSVGAQGYSMLQYGKTFCEDVTAFIMQLPPVGKGAMGVVLLWILYVLFG